MKRFVNTVILVLLVAALLPMQQPVAAQPPAQEFDRSASYVPGEVVVTFQEGLSLRTLRARANAMAHSIGATVVEQYEDVALLSLDPQADVFSASARLAAANQVVRAQPNYVYWVPEAVNAASEAYPVESYTLSAPGGASVELSWDQVAQLRSKHRVGSRLLAMPTYPREFTTSPVDGSFWGWNKIQADLIWSDSKNSGYVCVLDTGVDMAHPDLSGMVVNGYDFVNNDSRSYDDNGHGTHVAGIIAAKINTGDGTAMGVSKNKILAIKVLNAQGFGTTYNIAAGVKSCLKNSAAKVINMSFGMNEPDSLMKTMLAKAVSKGRVIVAAAGNETTSQPMYPAAWSTDPDLGGSIIAVAAGRAPAPYRVWVDKDGDGYPISSKDASINEMFDSTECATGLIDSTGAAAGSNYGNWVDLVAPGENIYSTTPVSYPFYLNYYNGVPSGYAYLDGTSMAAGFVSGAVARVLTTGVSPAGVKARLLANGEPLDYAVDETIAEPTDGFDNTSRAIPGNGDTLYGVPFGSDPDDANLQIVMAPFCWPNASSPFGANQDMSHARYLNVAKAMLRGALVAEVKDALSGTPTSGANVSAVMSGITYDQSITNNTPFVVLINLPDTGKTYDLKVAKTGSTTGYQVFNKAVAIQAGYSRMDDYSTVSLPSNVNMHAVLDWLNPVASPDDKPEVTVDLDLYLVLPSDSGCGQNCLIGNETIWDGDQFKYQLDTYTANHFFGAGTLLRKEDFDGVWSPMAIHNFDGVSHIIDKGREMGNPTESVTIRFGKALRGNPYYTAAFPGTYEFVVTDNSPAFTWYDPITKQGYLDKDPLLANGVDPNPFYVAPVVRYWSKGYILQTVRMPEASTCTGANRWWRPLTLKGSSGKVTATNTCASALPMP